MDVSCNFQFNTDLDPRHSISLCASRIAGGKRSQRVSGFSRNFFAIEPAVQILAVQMAARKQSPFEPRQRRYLCQETRQGGSL